MYKKNYFIYRKGEYLHNFIYTFKFRTKNIIPTCASIKKKLRKPQTTLNIMKSNDLVYHRYFRYKFNYLFLFIKVKIY